MHIRYSEKSQVHILAPNTRLYLLVLAFWAYAWSLPNPWPGIDPNLEHLNLQRSFRWELQRPFLDTHFENVRFQILIGGDEILRLFIGVFFDLYFGLAFEIPIATIILVWSGAITLESIKNKRPYVIVGCFIFGMLLTPPDVISQALLAIPMWFLFEIGIFLCKIFKLERL